MKPQTVSLLCLAAASSVSALENQPFANWLTVDGTWGACDKWASGHCTITCTDALLDGVTATVQKSDDIRAITLTNDGLIVLDNALLHYRHEKALLVYPAYSLVLHLPGQWTASVLLGIWRLQSPVHFCYFLS